MTDPKPPRARTSAARKPRVAASEPALPAPSRAQTGPLDDDNAAAPAAPRRALVSVYRKDGLGELARGLVQHGFEIVSTGGSAAALREAGVAVTPVQDVTGFPEILDGRVKTLHPRLHAGLLARRDVAAHVAALGAHGIAPIDVLVVNLYPFEDKVAKGAGFDEAVEHIDVGGPAMLRAAAKNFRHVCVVVDPGDYGLLLEQLEREGGPDAATRLYFAQKAFRHSARYEAAIAAYLAQVEVRDGEYAPAESDDVFPYRLALSFEKIQDLRYGENPHQRGAFYSDLGSTLYSVAAAHKLQGKELSFNNIVDLDAAWRLATELEEPACVIVKHSNPCGVGLGATLAEAHERACECDPLSAFGGILAFNRKLDVETARRVVDVFVEAVIAPGVERAAREVLASRKNLRVMDMDTTGLHKVSGFDLRRVVGGLLAQQWDLHRLERGKCDVVTKRKPSEDEWKALLFAWTVCKHVKSNAIVFASAAQTLGVGAGQMSRVDAARFAALKARLPLAGSVAASDAFFPFRDGLDEIARAGATAVIQPGGSVKDDEVIAAADEHGLAMVFTGVRHFRH
jgi:phosphoribosylaminoimidazolecarboxamide formyltransferase/IMP cyclohydrolase